MQILVRAREAQDLAVFLRFRPSSSGTDDDDTEPEENGGPAEAVAELARCRKVLNVPCAHRGRRCLEASVATARIELGLANFGAYGTRRRRVGKLSLSTSDLALPISLSITFPPVANANSSAT